MGLRFSRHSTISGVLWYEFDEDEREVIFKSNPHLRTKISILEESMKYAV